LLVTKLKLKKLVAFSCFDCDKLIMEAVHHRETIMELLISTQETPE
jgi:hypothetical protein